MHFRRVAWALVLVATGACAQDVPPAAARKALETTAAKGNAKALQQAVARRGGDWFDVVMTVVADPMPPLDSTRALIAALPDPEKYGIGPMLDEIAAAPREKRVAFAAAVEAVLAAQRAFGDAKGTPQALEKAVALAEERVAAAQHPWTDARAAIVRGAGKYHTGLAVSGPDLEAAREALRGFGDRFGAGLAAAFHAKALADAGDHSAAAAARRDAHELLGEAGALERGGAALKGTLARLDGALALVWFDEGLDDAALEACARARAAFKASDASRDLLASAIEAAILLDRGEAAAAAEATKAHLARVSEIKDKATLVRFSVAAAAALRLTGKNPLALDLLRKAVGRAKELAMTPHEEAPLRAATALAYIGSKQFETAHAALEIVAGFAGEPDLAALAKNALMNRAVLYQSQDRLDDVAKQLTRAGELTLGGPILDRVAAAGPRLALGEQLIEHGRLKEAMVYVREASALAEEMGIRLDDVRVATTTVVLPGPPLHARLATALSSYRTGPDWADLEPAFLVHERRMLDVLANRTSDAALPDDLAAQIAESDRQIRRLRRAAAGARSPISEEDALRAMTLRKTVMDEAWSRVPGFALRRFPRVGTARLMKDHYCGVDGAVLGVSVGADGGYVFVFTKDGFNFQPLAATYQLDQAVARVAELARDPKTQPAAWVEACAPLWANLIQHMLPIFETRQWLAVVHDATLDGVPFGALVPPDASGDDWRTLPYLHTRIAVGRAPTTGFAREFRTRRLNPWVPPPLDERVHVIPRGVGADSFKWNGPRPALIFAQEPAGNRPFEWMTAGAKSVIVPTRPMEADVADALVAGVKKALDEGLNPIEALTAAKRAFLGPVGGAAIAHHHLSQWSQLDVWLAAP